MSSHCQESRLIIRGLEDVPLTTSRFLLELVISSAFVFRARATSRCHLSSFPESPREGCLPNESTRPSRADRSTVVLLGPLRADAFCAWRRTIPVLCARRARSEGMRLSLEKSHWWLFENPLYGCPSRMIAFRLRIDFKFQVNTGMLKQLL